MSISDSRTTGRTADRWKRRLLCWYALWACVVITGLSLGLWQWERASDKQAMLTQFDTAPSLEAPREAPPEGARLTVGGEFIAERTLYLDNRTHDGRLGVAALTPLRGEDGRLWLVQRGFHETGPTRAEPRVATPTGSVTVKGRWQASGEAAPLFGPNREGRRLQRIDLAAWPSLGPFAHAGWLHQTSGDGQLTPWWQPNVLPPSRHLAYAFQWWGLAMAAIVIMLLGARRMRADRETQDGERR
ncbi:SURF1 family protein [Halomonas sp. 18H]|nr:SURF1 family protein [Halomonas sp. 18H]MCW4151794.1 SURF1 family protein [Halomonas sp. 18H]